MALFRLNIEFFDIKKRRELPGFESYDRVMRYHRRWTYDYLGDENNVRHE